MFILFGFKINNAEPLVSILTLFCAIIYVAKSQVQFCRRILWKRGGRNDVLPVVKSSLNNICLETKANSNQTDELTAYPSYTKSKVD